MTRSPLAALAFFGSILGSACIDRPNPVPAPGSETPQDRLSALGIFAGDPREQIPAEGFVPYEVNVELWSDGARKRRFLYVPLGRRIDAEHDRWRLPVGSYVVKTFSFPRDLRDPAAGEQLIETRLLVRTDAGLLASTYLWNDEQTDAVVSGGNVDVPVRFVDAQGATRTQAFHVPGTSQCGTCHDDRTLGLRTRQMDRLSIEPGVEATQIERLLELGYLAAQPAPRSRLAEPFGDAPLGERARSYLDGNCGHCHAPGREAAGTEVYWDYGHTDGALPLCKPSLAIGDAEHVIFPGSPARSTLVARMRSNEPFLRMPLGPNHLVDERGLLLLEAWIAAMPSEGCP